MLSEIEKNESIFHPIEGKLDINNKKEKQIVQRIDDNDAHKLFYGFTQ